MAASPVSNSSPRASLDVGAEETAATSHTPDGASRPPSPYQYSSENPIQEIRPEDVAQVVGQFTDSIGSHMTNKGGQPIGKDIGEAAKQPEEMLNKTTQWEGSDVELERAGEWHDRGAQAKLAAAGVGYLGANPSN